jgi:multicomponent Na+:H+ antiporter subunit B
MVLLRGHNHPGGGFAGGLLAAAAFALQAISQGVESARNSLPAQLHVIGGAGLSMAAATASYSLFLGEPLFTSHGMEIAGVFVGTVLLFDTGVYFTVFTALLVILFTLMEE